MISTNVSLDGVVQDPDGREGFRLGGWFREFGGRTSNLGEGPVAEAGETAALLLGRRSDAWFAERWTRATTPGRTG